jgi:hypothetical protein
VKTRREFAEMQSSVVNRYTGKTRDRLNRFGTRITDLFLTLIAKVEIDGRAGGCAYGFGGR